MAGDQIRAEESSRLRAAFRRPSARSVVVSAGIAAGLCGLIVAGASRKIVFGVVGVILAVQAVRAIQDGAGQAFRVRERAAQLQLISERVGLGNMEAAARAVQAQGRDIGDLVAAMELLDALAGQRRTAELLHISSTTGQWSLLCMIGEHLRQAPYGDVTRREGQVMDLLARVVSGESLDTDEIKGALA